MSSKNLQSPTSTPNKKLNPAFTLIELSVVLIIIGLIVGGVLVGKDLLKAAQLRSSISILEKSSAAINTFRLKYNALPGDIQNPEQFGLGISGGIGHGGNGNGSVFSYRYWDSTSLAWQQSTEIYNLWLHLSQAGLVAESYTGVSNSGTKPNLLEGYMPRFKYTSEPSYVIALTSEDVNTRESIGNAFVISSFNTPNAIVPGTNNFGQSMTALEAYSIDVKLDDGIPNSGIVLAMYPTVGPYWSDGTAYACSTLGTTYDINGLSNMGGADSPAKPESIDCSLIIKASW